MRRGLILCLSLLLLVACGHRKGPTGGPRDTVAPTITSIEPAPFSEIGTLTVTFSKPMDRSTIASGFQTYPPILRKQFIWKDLTTLVIKFNEAFDEDTNYFLNFTDGIQCTHGNPLDKNYTYIYRHGKLQDARLAGRIQFESPADSGQPVNLTLWSADSVRVYDTVVTESSFALENLNPDRYFIDAWIDHNGNGKYDYGTDSRARSEMTETNRDPLLLRMTVQDTIPPRLARALSKANNSVEAYFKESVTNFRDADIVSADSLREAVPIRHQILHDDHITFVTEPRSGEKYRLRVFGATDKKGNVCRADSIIFTSTARRDSIPPLLETSLPRNGATVTSFSPEIRLLFSEVIPKDCLQVSLENVETKEGVSLDILQTDSDVCVVKPYDPLTNYSSYKLRIGTETRDSAGNHLPDPIELTFMVIVPEGK